MGAIQITLSGYDGGYKATVDEFDAERVLRVNWRAARHRNTVYACRRGLGDSEPGTVYLHRFVLDAPRGLSVDHINGMGLDNRRANLRLATQSQNSANSVRHRDGRSRFKGIYFDRDTGRWRAEIAFAGRKLRLGRFARDTDAALAYDAKARELFGEFAAVNFPSTDEHRGAKR